MQSTFLCGLVSSEKFERRPLELKVWSKPRLDIGKKLAGDVSVARNGYIAIGSSYAHHFSKFAVLLYSEDGFIAIKPVSERSRNSYTVNRLPGRSSRIINAASFVIEVGIRSQRYKAHWFKDKGMLVFKAKILGKPN